MYCKYCGAVIDNDSRFCAQCGRQLSENDIVAEKAVWTDFNDYQQNTTNLQREIENSIEQEKPELLDFEIRYSYCEDQHYFLPIDTIHIWYRVKKCNWAQLLIKRNRKIIQIRNLEFQNEDQEEFDLDLKEYNNLGEELAFQLELGNDTWTVKSKELTAKIATNFDLKKYEGAGKRYKISIIAEYVSIAVIVITVILLGILFPQSAISVLEFLQQPIEGIGEGWNWLIAIAINGCIFGIINSIWNFIWKSFRYTRKEYCDNLRKHN